MSADILLKDSITRIAHLMSCDSITLTIAKNLNATIKSC